MMGDNVTFKVVLNQGTNENVRMFMLPNSSKYEQLTSKLVELFPQLKDGTFRVTYTDDDDDELPISTDEELIIFMTRMIVKKLYVSHTKPAPVKAPKPERCFTVRLKGETGCYLPNLEGGGIFTITNQKHRGRPVYSMTTKGDLSQTFYLYSLSSGGWAVASRVDDSIPDLKSGTSAASPALCKEWEYAAQYYNYSYHYCAPGDITFKV